MISNQVSWLHSNGRSLHPWLNIKGLANTSASFDASQCISMQLWQLHSICHGVMLSTMEELLFQASSSWSCEMNRNPSGAAFVSCERTSCHICLGRTAPAFVCSIISSGTPRRASCNCACASCLGIQSETWISYLAGSDPHDAAENLVLGKLHKSTLIQRQSWLLDQQIQEKWQQKVADVNRAALCKFG